MRKIATLFLIFSIIGCGKKVPFYTESDPAFDPYLKELRALSMESVGIELRTDIPINYHDIDAICRCRNKMEILVNKKSFDSFPKDWKLSILLHEIGHCIYLRDHKDGKIELSGETISSSVMSTKAVDGKTFIDNLKYYFSEFFDPTVSQQSRL